MKKSKPPQSDMMKKDNFYFHHMLKCQQWYLLLLMLIILTIPFLINITAGKPLFFGGESYSHLNASQNPTNLFHYFLNVLVNILPEKIYLLIPLLLAIGSMILFFRLSNQLNLPKKFTFFYLILLIFTPAFINTFSAISFYSLALFLILAGLVLFHFQNKYVQYCSIIPWSILTFMETFSSIVMLILLALNYSKKKNNFTLAIIFSVTSLLTLLNSILLQPPLIFGPFREHQILIDFISDLGNLRGMSFFIFILAFIGLFFTWKRKESYFAYFLLIPLFAAYLYSSQTIFFITLLAIFFATTSFIKIFEKKWKLTNLKKFTFLLLVLGLIFSTVSYYDRIPAQTPLAGDLITLSWIKENTKQDAMIFSAPEYAPYIAYFARRQPFSSLSSDNKVLNITQNIFSSAYIQELFPLLEENNLSYIYITPSIKSSLPTDQGLLFLFKNEKFKLVHSYEGFEVWKFSDN